MLALAGGTPEVEMLTLKLVSISTIPCVNRVMFIGRIRFDGNATVKTFV
jgi:hypothetical protein